MSALSEEQVRHGDSWKDHVVIYWEDLAEALGLEGDVVKVYSEADSDYLHIHLTGKSSEAYLVARGGFVEPRGWDRIARRFRSKGARR